MLDPISSPGGEAKSATESRPRPVVVGMGTNQGDRLAFLTRAAAALATLGTVEAVASLWESEAVGPPQPRYWNSAVRLRASGSAAENVERLLAIEAELGRVRTVRWGPRVIDLDLLWIDGEVSEDPRAEVPHPRLHERSFALAPLLELVPGARDPRTGLPFPEASAPALERVGAGELEPLGWRLFAR
jgi:2-amino-4-hydroxy-6-hydroxymethyldihydropteridine diphosphokinase